VGPVARLMRFYGLSKEDVLGMSVREVGAWKFWMDVLRDEEQLLACVSSSPTEKYVRDLARRIQRATSTPDKDDEMQRSMKAMLLNMGHAVRVHSRAEAAAYRSQWMARARGK